MADSEWREYNVHGDVQPVDIFASSEVEYDLYQYDCRGGKLIELAPTDDGKAPSTTRVTLRSERSYDKSTGMSIWRGSEILCSFVLSHRDTVCDKRLLEIGAGVGLCGIVCATQLDATS